MSENVLEKLTKVTENVEAIARSAGSIILPYFRNADTKSETKADGSPVTEADEAAELFITQELEKLYPNIPVVGEEGSAAGEAPDLDGVETFWLVDPLDGTGAFKRGSVNFTVNIALIHNHKPVLGVIYAPAKDEMYCGHMAKESRAYKRVSEDADPETIMARKAPEEGLEIMTSGNPEEKDLYKRFMKQFEDIGRIANTVHCSSSIKMCYIASGDADIYLRIGPTKEWDTAAGHAILNAAGGDICDMAGKSLRYGVKNGMNLYNPAFLVASDDLIPQTKLLRDLIQENPSETLPFPD